ncbi:hypothetical protein Tdes44962_MAKER00628 [Teratosphaeria destructans]|uniref:Uncharacterized protein n=1 Tax=Teratosphaeria destructans TaxID=418781 RepID=A0A9W7W0F1_9PEZI|nr:hypothetical protein Tdes44962_MAKER00628 [Teratosphaeria destructans]
MDEAKPLPSFARTGTGLSAMKPVRSRTDPPPPAPVEKERNVLSRRLHSNTVSGRVNAPASGHHHHRHRDRVRETVHSATELRPPISFDLLRRDKKTPDSGRGGSNSHLAQQQQRDIEEWQAQQRAYAEREARRRVKPEDVEKAKAENLQREEQLRQTLKHVEELGMSSMRQLDDTYYAILEKASILRSTIAGLQQLAEETRRMHTQFEEDTKSLEADTDGNIAAFGEFEEQEKTISGLVGRLKTSKTETQKLNERLEAARDRVEAFEKKENARQSKRRKQWHATWGSAVGVVVLLVAILILKNHRGMVRSLDGVGQSLAAVGDAANEQVSRLLPSPSPKEDPYLQRLFDEL